MKILLLRPKYEFDGYTPTSLAMLAAIAQNLGHKVTIIDLNIDKLPKDNDFEIVGITGLSLWKNTIVQLSKQFPSSTVIVGGPWASLHPEEALSHKSINYVCLGEGENTWRNFLIHYPTVQGIEGIGYSIDGCLRFDGEKLDEITSYLQKPRKIHCLTSLYWTPEYIINVCKEEYKKNLRNLLKQRTKLQALRKLIKNPFSALRILREAI